MNFSTNPKNLKKFTKILGLTTLCVALASCNAIQNGLNKTSSQISNFFSGNSLNIAPSITSNNLSATDNQLLNQINNPNATIGDLQGLSGSISNPFVQNALALRLATLYSNQGNYSLALQYLNQYRPSQDPLQQSQYSYLATKIGYATNNQALLATTNPVNPQAIQVNSVLQETEAQLVQSFKNNNLDDGLNQVDTVYPTLNPLARQALVDSTLKQLISLTSIRLNSLAQNAVNQGNVLNAGWYSLALNMVKNSNNPQTLSANWQNWLQTYGPNKHPASISTPSLFKSVNSANVNYNNIAVLLPLNARGNVGSFAQAIRDGIIQANIDTGTQANLNFYDTSTTSVDQALQQATNLGANLIIGPLLRDNVAKATNTELKVPELMLNTIGAANPNACYMSLSIDDEAATGAQAFYALKVKTPVIFTDNSSTNARGVNAFKEAWIKLTGQDPTVVVYNAQDLNTKVLDLTTMDPKPDSVFFLGIPEALTAFQQDLNFTLPGNHIRTIATSQSNAAFLTKTRLNDFSHLYFTESSIIGDPNTPQTRNALNTLGTANYPIRRFYAFGYDAFTLGQEFGSLKNNPLMHTKALNGSFYRENPASDKCILSNNMYIYHVVNGKFLRVN